MDKRRIPGAIIGILAFAVSFLLIDSSISTMMTVFFLIIEILAIITAIILVLGEKLFKKLYSRITLLLFVCALALFVVGVIGAFVPKMPFFGEMASPFLAVGITLLLPLCIMLALAGATIPAKWKLAELRDTFSGKSGGRVQAELFQAMSNAEEERQIGELWRKNTRLKVAAAAAVAGVAVALTGGLLKEFSNEISFLLAASGILLLAGGLIMVLLTLEFPTTPPKRTSTAK